jgi:hypothetical protein
MVAYVSATENGKSKIEFVNIYGITLVTIEVDAIHVETKQENIEPVNRKFKRAGRFVQ